MAGLKVRCKALKRMGDDSYNKGAEEDASSTEAAAQLKDAMDYYRKSQLAAASSHY